MTAILFYVGLVALGLVLQALAWQLWEWVCK